MANCTTFLDVNLRLGDKKAIIHPAGKISYTYHELLENVCRRGNLLYDNGIGRGDRVCIFLPASADYILWFLAIWRIGAVVVPLNNVLRETEVQYLLDNSTTRLIITDKNGARIVSTLRESTASLSGVIVTGTVELGERLSSSGTTLSAEFCSSDDLCQLQYTSGTTGKPKGAMLTHGNWMAAMDAEREVLGVVEDDVFLGIYPMAHIGISWGISVLRAGATWVILERFDLEKYISLIEEYNCTVVAGMPPVIHSLTKTPVGREESLKSARVMISGGGPLHPGIWKEFYLRFHIPIVNAYGLSETIVVGTGTAIRPDDYANADEFQSVGTPVGFSEVKIVDVNDPSLDSGLNNIGEIALRGPAVAQGYWKMPEETAEIFMPDGWFLTGDIGYINSDGMVSITDRKKDMIVMSGWKIYPTEVEEVLINHPKIEDIALFGCPDDHSGEVPVAAVILSSGEELSAEELRVWAKEKLAGYKIPRRMVVLDELPRVNGWKLLRRTLRDSFCDEKIL